MATFPSLNNNVVRFVSNGWFIEMSDRERECEYRIRMVSLSTDRVFISKKVGWEEDMRPFLIQVCQFVERGMSPVGSPKWMYTGPARPCLAEHARKFAAWSAAQDDESTECRGCEHCDGEGGHSVADSRRQYEAVERMFASRRFA